MTTPESPPVHASLTVSDHENIYQTAEWWKAVVRYQYKDHEGDPEVAVYLWHRDSKEDEWTRKHKYVVKTIEAWQTDRELITNFLEDETPAADGDSYPVSDYYDVAAAETVFQTDEWWKAVVKIEAKGSYETEEVFVYLWQHRDGEWRRRQKYAISDKDEWEEQASVITEMLDVDESRTDIDTHSDSDRHGLEGDTDRFTPLHEQRKKQDVLQEHVSTTGEE